MNKMLPLILGFMAAVTVVMVFEPRQDAGSTSETSDAETATDGAILVDEFEEESDGLAEPADDQGVADSATSRGSVRAAQQNSLSTPRRLPRQLTTSHLEIAALRQRVAEPPPDTLRPAAWESLLERKEEQVLYLTENGLSVADAERTVDDVARGSAECHNSYMRQIDESDQAFDPRRASDYIEACTTNILLQAGLIPWVAKEPYP